MAQNWPLGQLLTELTTPDHLSTSTPTKHAQITLYGTFLSNNFENVSAKAPMTGSTNHLDDGIEDASPRPGHKCTPPLQDYYTILSLMVVYGYTDPGDAARSADTFDEHDKQQHQEMRYLYPAASNKVISTQMTETTAQQQHH